MPKKMAVRPRLRTPQLTPPTAPSCESAPLRLLLPLTPRRALQAASLPRASRRHRHTAIHNQVIRPISVCRTALQSFQQPTYLRKNNDCDRTTSHNRSLCDTAAKMTSMPATSGHSAACCNIPPIVTKGYQAKGSYEDLGGFKTCMWRHTPWYTILRRATFSRGIEVF